jgi:hypothetical protein
VDVMRKRRLGGGDLGRWAAGTRGFTKYTSGAVITRNPQPAEIPNPADLEFGKHVTGTWIQGSLQIFDIGS